MERDKTKELLVCLSILVMSGVAVYQITKVALANVTIVKKNHTGSY